MADFSGGMVVLFGAPTTGKDTVTAVLEEIDARFKHFVKHKHGTGRSQGYTMVTNSELDDLRNAGRVLSEVERYGATYVIERERVLAGIAGGRTLIIHSAEVHEARKLHDLGACVVVLECTRETARERLLARDHTTVHERLAVWDWVSSHLHELESVTSLRLSTDEVDPHTLAATIQRHLAGHLASGSKS